MVYYIKISFIQNKKLEVPGFVLARIMICELFAVAIFYVLHYKSWAL